VNSEARPAAANRQRNRFLRQWHARLAIIIPF
jgi:hypothetical protein